MCNDTVIIACSMLHFYKEQTDTEAIDYTLPEYLLTADRTILTIYIYSFNCIFCFSV